MSEDDCANWISSLEEVVQRIRMNRNSAYEEDECELEEEMDNTVQLQDYEMVDEEEPLVKQEMETKKGNIDKMNIVIYGIFIPFSRRDGL